jgi:hypothetical protein
VLTGGETPRVLATHDPLPAGADVRVRIADGDGGTDEGALRVAPAPPNAAPQLRADAVETPFGVPVELPLTATDPDGERLDVEVVEPPARGRVFARATASGTTLTYVPDEDASGDDRVVLRASDGTSASAPVTVPIAVGGPAQPPAPPAPQPAEDAAPDRAVPAPPAPGGTPPPSDAPAGAIEDAVVQPADVLVLPAARRCVSRRRFTVTVRRPAGLAPHRRIQVAVNGKVVRTLRRLSTKSKTGIDLRGLPRGSVTVRLRLTLASGRVVTTQRTYRTCAGKPKTKPTRTDRRTK